MQKLQLQQRQQQLKRDKLVFVFDFDQTLTMEHSGGEPDPSDDYIVRMDLLVAMLERLYDMGISVYINTRGIATTEKVSVRTYLKERLDTLKKQQEKVGQQQTTFKKLIKDVYGADSEDSIGNPFDTKQARQSVRTQQQYIQKIEDVFYKTDAEVIKVLGELNDESSRVWAHQKLLYLDKIAKRAHVPKENVYFFDDTVINVCYAKAHGYIHSYRIFDGSNPRDPSLLRTNKRYLEYTSILVNAILDQLWTEAKCADHEQIQSNSCFKEAYKNFRTIL